MPDPEEATNWERDYAQLNDRGLKAHDVGGWANLAIRAAAIIKWQADELDKANLRDVRDEELIAKLRQQLGEARALLGDETASEAFASAHNDTVRKC